MKKAKELTKNLWEKVTGLYKIGKGHTKISKELRILVSSVESLIQKWKMRLKSNLPEKNHSNAKKKHK